MQQLENYHTCIRESTELIRESSPPSALPGGGEPLVNKFISPRKKDRKNPVKSLQLYPRAVKLVRDFRGKTPEKVALRKEISSFSHASKRRLKFTASNAFPALVSQFAMTYHQTSPDGRTIKNHLDTFLKALSRKYPDARYLWILEFQTRMTPHFHLFLTLSHDTNGLHKFLADTWHRIAEPDSEQHKRFHRHKRNFIAWDMGSGSYLCKYLDKEHQKAVPAEFEHVGRFWGGSRSLVPDPVEFEADYANYDNVVVDEETGEIIEEFHATEYVIRQLCKHHEKSLRNSPWRSSARKRPTSYTLPNGAAVLLALEKYLWKLPQADPVPF